MVQNRPLHTPRRKSRLDKRSHRARIEGRGRNLKHEMLERRELLAAEIWQPLGPFAATGGQVENVVPGDEVVGAIHTVIAHPTDPDTLYIGSVNGGVWRTNNATDLRPNWTPLTDKLPSSAIGAMTFDVGDPTFQTIYAGTGRYSSFGRIGGERVGLIRSTDGGNTWSLVDPGGTLFGKNISGVYANGNTIVVSVNTADSFNANNVGIFRSTDGGASFAQVSRGDGGLTGLPAGAAYDLVADPVSPNVLYTMSVFSASLGGGQAGIYKSSNQGASWTKVSNSLMDALIDDGSTNLTGTSNLELAVGQSNNVYAAIINSGRLAGLFRSGNGGGSWIAMDIPATNENGTDIGLNPTGGKGPVPGSPPEQLAGGQGAIHFSIVADPTNPFIVYAGGDRQPSPLFDAGGGPFFPNSIGANDFSGRLFRGDASQPRGSQWVHLTHSRTLGAAGGGTLSSSAPHADSREMVFDAAGNLIEVDDGGVYRRTDPRTNQGDWFSIIGDLQVTEPHDIAYDAISNIVITGNQDTGTTQQPLSGAAIWESVSTADGGDVTVDDVSLAGSGQSIRYSSFQNLGAFRARTYDASGAFISETFPALQTVSGTPIAPAFRNPVELNSVDPTQLVFQGNNGTYESFDQGNTLIQIPTAGGVPSGNASILQNAIVAGGVRNGLASDRLLWVGSGFNLLGRTPTNGTLTPVPTAPPVDGVIRDVAVDPQDWNSVIVADSNTVALSQDAGSSWIDITFDLLTKASSLWSLAFVDGPIVDAVLAGTNVGVFATAIDALGTWLPVGLDLPNVPAFDMELDTVDDVLVAGMFGRGAWLLNNVTQAVEDTILEGSEPNLIAVAPNSGDLFDLDPQDQVSNLRLKSPTELVLTFGGPHSLDAGTLGAITVQYSESGNFSLDAVAVPIGFIGLDDSGRSVTMRFAENLRDGFYQLAVTSELTSIFGVPFKPNFPGPVPGDPSLVRDVISFELELGAKITAIVSQPIQGGVQRPSDIDVYFDDIDLFRSGSTIGNPAFYQLVDTQNTVTTEDDLIITPTGPVVIDVPNRKVTLSFAAPLDTYAAAGDSLRLRIGDSTVFNSISVAQHTPATDPGLTLATASTIPVAASGDWSTVVVGQEIRNTTANGIVSMVDNPGGIHEPGHRDIEVEDHFLIPGNRDGNNSITTLSYSFFRNRSYATNSSGQPLFNEMNAEQEKRFLEILDIYSARLGIDFFEVDTGASLRLIVGDLSTADPTVVSGPGGVAGLGGPGGVTMDSQDFTNAEDNLFGGSFFGVALHEIGHAIGLGHSYDLAPGTVQGAAGEYPDPTRPGPGTEWAFPGDNDIVHGLYLHQKESQDVDFYRVNVTEAGVLRAQTFAERLPDASLLDTSMMLYRVNGANLELVSANEDYFGSDSLMEIRVQAGTYVVAVASEGNTLFDPDAGAPAAGGTSEGSYELRVDFTSESVMAIRDADGSLLDGDRDGMAGGNYSFWFEPTRSNTIYVNKAGGSGGGALGSITNPYTNIPAALAAAQAAIAGGAQGIVVRLLPNGGVDNDVTTPGDNLAYEVGFVQALNRTLADGRNLDLPGGIHFVIDAGVIMKFLDSRISVGSDDDGNDRSESTISVQGTPDLPVYFTSYNDRTLGSNSNPLPVSAAPGNWGGIEIRNDVDRLQGRLDVEQLGIFQNYVNHAQFSFGGGGVSTINRTIDPIQLSEARAEVSYNHITTSSDAAISADPNTFGITTFTEPRFQKSSISAAGFVTDYDRLGPTIYGNLLSGNSTNGLFIRIDTPPGGGLETLSVPARFNDTDIVHVLGENLIIEGAAGGPLQDSNRPAAIIGIVAAAGGTLAAGNYQYSYTFVDSFGFESPGSTPQALNGVPVGSLVNLTDIPAATGKYVARRLYRSVGGGPFRLVAELDKTSSDHTDNVQTPSTSARILDTTDPAVRHGRLDGSLIVDPGLIIKNQGARIQLGFGSTLLAEGLNGSEVIFTGRSDDRFGAGGTFDTNANGVSRGTPGEWPGIYAEPTSRLSIDHALVAFAGGETGVNGGTANFNPIQIHQADTRIVNTLFEQNADGLGATQGSARRDFAPNGPATIFVTTAQPILLNNTFIDNEGAVISINVNSLTSEFVTDPGRQTGSVDLVEVPPANNGAVIRGNRMAGNDINGLNIRGEVLTTEVVWDDTDIVHVLQRDIEIPDLHTYGGLRLESSSTESLVVKARGAEILATGRSLDITDRIGGRLLVIGQPGFPVVITSLFDNTVGAGFTPDGLVQTETETTLGLDPSAGDWQGLRLDQYSHDRNLAVATEREGTIGGFGDSNATIGKHQELGLLAANERSGDENIRLGFTVHGAIANDKDVDLYSFDGVGGTIVWIDIDRTDPRLDTVLELIDGNGRVLALSQNSRSESNAGQLTFTNTSLLRSGHGLPMRLDHDAAQTAGGEYRDLFTTNDGDSAMRVVLPGTTGTRNTFYVRVRSSNAAANYTTTAGITASLATGGTSRGGYELQVRLQETDEHAGSTIRYADLRYASAAIVAVGLPSRSPIAGELFNPGGALALGNFSNTDRGAVSVAGVIDATPDTYSFNVGRDALQGVNPTDNSLGIVIDIDWADGLTRPNTNAYLFNGTTLIAIGTDSNVSDDRITPIVPGQPSTQKDLSRGTHGTRDAFIGPLELSPTGDYQVIVANNGQVPADMAQFFRINPPNTNARLEPIDSVVRIADDHFDFEPAGETDTPIGPAVEIPQALQVAFHDNGSNILGWQFGDVPLITISELAELNGGTNSQINIYNPFTGRHDGIIDENTSPVGAAAARPIIRQVPGSDPARFYNVLAIERPNSGSTPTDGNTDTVYAIDVEGTLTSIGATGITTYEYFNNGDADPATNSNRVAPLGRGGMRFSSLAYYNDTDSESSFLYGLANRVTFDGSIVGADANNNDIISGLTVPVNASNLIYLLNPNTGAAISRNGISMRGGFESASPQDPRLQNDTGFNIPREAPWAGTDIIAQVQVPTTDSVGNPTGNVTSLVTDINGGRFLYAFTDNGTVWQFDIEETDSTNYNPGDLRVTTALDATQPTGRRLADGNIYVDINGGEAIVDSAGNTLIFEQVTQGPANFLDGSNDTFGLSNFYFGVQQGTGRLYAFTLGATGGTTITAFEFGGEFTQLDTASAGNAVAGIFFSSLDRNLWHTSDTLSGAPGHGMGALDDRAAVVGGGSLRFGFDDLSDDHNHLNFTGIFDTTLDAEDMQGFRGYNFLGGSHGSIQSNILDLSGFSADDLPTLYFTYLLDSENVNADDNPGGFNDGGLDDVMRDSLRVSVVGEDGIWRLVATNNMADSINGRIWEDSRGNVHEYDPVGSNSYTDAESQRFVQELFDDDVFRQARIDLGPWAGQRDVRIRFEFSTAGEARPDQSEIHALRGEAIRDAHRLTIQGVMPERTINNQGDALFNRTKTFEFDLGLVVQMPAGSQVAAAGGSITLTRPGGSTIVELVTGVAGVGQVSVLATDTASIVANKVAAFIGATAVRSPANPAWVGFTAEAAVGTYTFTGINSFILGTPGVAGTNLPIPIDISMTDVAVRDQIQLALANEIHFADSVASLAAFPVVGNTSAVRIYDLRVSQSNFSRAMTLINGEFAGASNMPGSAFGVYAGTTSVSTLLRAGERSRAVGGDNGVYIDDIVIGLADRGESFTGANQGTALVDNPYFEALKYFPPFEDAVRPVRQEITVGEYQLEVRLGREYLGVDNVGKDARIAINERLADGLNLQVEHRGSELVDGDTFTISNGFETVRFEFNDITVPALTTPTTPGNVAVGYLISNTTGQVADAIRNAINSSSVRAALGVEATSQSGRLTDATDPVILFHGFAAANTLGGIGFTSPESGMTHLTGLITGQNVVRGEDNGDRNLRRDQGVFVVDSNVISFTAGTAIAVTAAPVAAGVKVPAEGDRPKPGAVQHLSTLSTEELVHGAVVQNNLLISNGDGIVLSGNPAQGGPFVYSRILNNTIYDSDTAITIRDQAAPTLLNNVLMFNSVGIDKQNQGPTVIRATVYNLNNVDASDGVLGTEALVDPPGPLFVNPSSANFNLAEGNPNFYPAAGSVLIDSSIESQLDRSSIIAVKDAGAIPPSPIVVTDRDLAGQLRQNGSTSSGQGNNLNIDRGALDRADTIGPQALLIVPTDNDAAGIDIDRNDTFLQLTQGVFKFFEILITEDAGIGPDQSTITTDQILVFENGRQLVDGINVIISYSSTNRTLRIQSPSGLWRPDGVYEIILLNKLAVRPSGTLINPVADLAGNPLQPNRADGQTRFTILMPQVELDFGDAPNSYGTLFASDGARHAVSQSATPRLGQYVDTEPDSAAGVNSDDLVGAITVDGNVGEAGNGPFTIGPGPNPTVTLVSLPQPFDNLSVTAANRTIVFELVEGGGTAAVNRVPVDYPAGSSLSEIMDRLSDVMQTALLDQYVQAVVQHTPGSTTLTLVGQDDEDGVAIGLFVDAGGTPVNGVFLDPATGGILSFLNPSAANGSELAIHTVGGGFVDAWVDFSGDGDFLDVDEHVLRSVPVVDGENRVQVFTPALPGVLVSGTGQAQARFRLSSVGNQLPSGLQIDGEVEDYVVFIADAPIPEPSDDGLITMEDVDLLNASISGNDDLAGADPTSIRYVKESDPVHGTLTFDPITGVFSYDPEDEFYGEDSFTYRITGTQTVNGITLPVRSSGLATVTLTVLPVNDAPAAINHARITTEPSNTNPLTAVTITSTELLTGAVPDGTPMTMLPPWDELEQQLRVINIRVFDATGATVDVVGTVDPLAPPDGMYVATTHVNNGAGSFLPVGTVTVTVTGNEVVSVVYQGADDYNRNNPANGLVPSLDQFIYVIADDGATTLPDGQPAVPQPAPQTALATVTIEVQPQNDPPIANDDTIPSAGLTPGPREDVPFTIPLSFLTANDFAGPAGTLDENAGINDGPVLVVSGLLPSGLPAFPLGTLQGGTVVVDPLSGNLIYTPAPDYNGPDSFVYFISDQGVNIDGAVTLAPKFASATVFLTVTAVNDAPSAFDQQFVTLEDNSLVNRPASDLLVGSQGDASPQQPFPLNESNQTTRISALIVNGVVVNQSNFASGGPFLTSRGGEVRAVFTGGFLQSWTYIPATNFNEDDPLNGGLDSFGFTVQDDGVPPAEATATASIRVYPRNDFPVPAVDLISGSGSAWNAYFASLVPAVAAPIPTEDLPLTIPRLFLLANDLNGPLTARDENALINDKPLTIVQQRIPTTLGGTITFLPNGDLQYLPPANASGFDTFTYTVADAGVQSDEQGNEETESLRASAVVSIFLTPVNDPPLLDDPNDVTMPEDTTLRTVVLTGIAAGGGESQTLRVTAVSNNTTLLPHPAVNYNSPDSSGTLSLIPAPDQFGFTTVVVTVEDAGLDGILDDNPATPVNESADNLTVSRSLNVRVNSVNDAPTLNVIGDQTVSEDSLARSVGLSGITAGGGESQPLRVTATSSNPTLVANPTVTYSSPNAVGSVSFTPEPDQFGTATITVTVEDGGADGQLSTPADNLKFSRSFVLSVSPVNDEPSLAPLVDQMIDEDAAAQDITLNGILAGPNETQSLRVVATSDNPGLIADPVVVYTSPLNTGTLTFIPSPDRFGSATITVRVEDGGDDNDLSTTADNLTAQQTFAVIVRPVNDVPTIDPVADQSVDEDDPVQTVALTGVTAGGGETQPIAITATSSNTALVANPTVIYTSGNATGTLQFVPLADAFGTATITIVLEDGGQDGDLATTFDNGTSTETFLVTVQPVNDDPTLAVIANQTALEDSGIQTVALSGITAGASETDPLRVTATSGNPALVTNLSVSYISPNAFGSLSYTPQPDQFGSTTITVTVEDGGLDGNLATAGDNGTFSRVIQVTIAPVNDPPTLDDPADLQINEDAPQQVVALSGITAGAGESQLLRVVATSGTPGLIPNPVVTYSSPSATGSLAFTPVVDAFGVATITVTVEDAGLDGNFATVSDNLAFSQSFTVTILNRDDPPQPEDDTFDSDEDRALRIDESALLLNDTDPDFGTGSTEQISIVLPALSTSNLGATVTFDATTRRITYDPSTSMELQALSQGETRQDFFTYGVTDANGETNPPTATVFLNVRGVNDAPLAVDDVVPAPIGSEPVVIRPLDNDSDIDGTLDVNSIIITEDPRFGSVAKRVTSAGILELAYTPFDTFPGGDFFRYTIADNLGQPSGQATVTIEPDRSPRTAPDVAGGVAADNVRVEVLANDSAVVGQLDIATLTVVQNPANGQAVPQTDGTILYIPNPGFFGVDSFRYTIADTEGNVSAATPVAVRAVESGLQNPLRFADVNANGEVTSLDALLIINKLGTGGGQAAIPVDPDDRGPNFFDVSGNLFITALDALQVINHIGGEAPVIGFELVGERILAGMQFRPPVPAASQRIDQLFRAAGSQSAVAAKLVDASLGGIDEDMLGLLAASQGAAADDGNDDDADDLAALMDLAIRDLL
jgi:hypothetical protein